MKWIKNIHRPDRITVTTMVHIPFLGGYWKRRKVIQSPLPLEASTPFGDEIIIDNLNFWWLATTKYLVHHMGNKVPSLQDELGWMKDKTLPFQAVSKYKSSARSKFLQNELVRSVLKYLNVLTYRLLYKK